MNYDTNTTAAQRIGTPAKQQWHEYRNSSRIGFLVLIKYECWIEDAVKNHSTCHKFGKESQWKKIIPHDIAGQPWEIIDADRFIFNSSYFLCILHNLIVKEAEGLLAEQLIRCCELIFAECRLPWKISDTVTNYVSEKFRKYWRKLNIEQTISSSYNHQSNS